MLFSNTRRRLVITGIAALITIACSCALPYLLFSTPSPAANAIPTAIPINVAPSPGGAVATQCEPTITANTDVNVRKGPSKAYESVDILAGGETESVIGRSEEKYGEWWVINESSAPDGRGWVWGEAVTSSCIPANLQVIVAPEAPVAPVAAATDTEQAPPPGGGSWGVTTADIALTDIFTRNWPQDSIHVTIANNGPDSLSNIPNNQLYCTIETKYYSGIHPIPPVLESSDLITLNLSPGKEESFDTGIAVDGTDKWFIVTCSIQANFKDPESSNNSHTGTLPPPP